MRLLAIARVVRQLPGQFLSRYRERVECWFGRVGAGRLSHDTPPAGS